MPAQSDLFYFGLNGGPNAIAQFSKTTYRGAKITVQASSNVEHQLSEMYLLHDNNLAYIRQLDFIYTTDPFVVFTATIDSNNVYLRATSGLPNTDIVIFATLFDNPVTASDKGVNFDSIVSNATAISSLYPDDKTDYAAAMGHRGSPVDPCRPGALSQGPLRHHDRTRLSDLVAAADVLSERD